MERRGMGGSGGAGRGGVAAAVADSGGDAGGGGAASVEDDMGVDIDIALDKMMGEAFAEHVSAWLVEQGHPAASYGVTACNPDQSKHLETARMRVLDVWVDLVNLRTETYAADDSRIPSVAIGTPFEDAMRRDLTINALFYNINTGDVEDFTGNGLADIRARVVRTPLAPRTTLLDDPLRALRAIRFASRLNFIFDPHLYEACQDPAVHTALGAKVSRERVSIEVDQILSSAAPVHALGLLVELGLFPVVFRLPSEDQYVGEARPPDDLPAISLGCLINLDRLEHHHGGVAAAAAAAADAPVAPASSPNSSAVAASPPFSNCRLARYAALLAPLASMRALFGETGKKRKPVPLATYILRSELRMGTKDVAAVATILESSLEFKALVHRSSAELDQLERLVVGRLMRKAGPLWPIALQTALLTEISPAAVAETYARGINTMPDALAMESEVVVLAYGAFRRRVEAMGLDGVWDLRPLVDGRELAKLLPSMKRGPVIGEIMAAQVDYMIENRGVGVEKVRRWITETYPQYL